MISKVSPLKKVTYFRPVSLCNVVYKIIAKMVSTRLRFFLLDIISPTRSVFVPERMITNNVVVIYECFRRIKNKSKGKKNMCAIVAIQPQMVESLCISVIPGSVMLTHTVLEEFLTKCNHTLITSNISKKALITIIWLKAI